MHRTSRLLMATLCCAAVIAGLSYSQSARAQSAQAQKRSITEKDIFQFNWIGDPQISPDGAHVAFVKVSVNEKKDGYDTSIWSVSTRGDASPMASTTLHRASLRTASGWFLFVLLNRPQAQELEQADRRHAWQGRS